MTLDCHCLFMSLEYHNVENFMASGSKGSISGKVAPSGSSQVMKDEYDKPTKVELIPLVLCFSTIKL